MPGVLDGVRLHLVNSLAELWECARWAGERRDGPLCVDTESSGLSPYHHKMRLVQLGDKRHGWAFPPDWAGAAIDIVNSAPWLGMHNRPYDQRVLQQHVPGYRPRPEITEDTIPAAHICDSLRPAGLKARAAMEVDPRAVAGEVTLSQGMKANHWTWETVPIDWAPYWCYGALDPVLTAWMWDKFAPVVTGPQRQAYDLEKAMTRISVPMMDTGMMIDLPFIHERIGKIGGWHRQAMNELKAEFGISSVGSANQVMGALNALGIPTAVWTASGQPCIDKEALAFYAACYPQHAQLILKIRFARKAGDIIGKYLQKFLDLHIDGVMHYTINTIRARTSRQSVTDPPMQTFDRDEPAIRGSFRPRPGHALITIDADQIEMRLAAHFSQDQNLIADFLEAERTGQSFFVLAASGIYGQEITKKDPRYTQTKNASYGQVYGAGLDKAAVTAGVPVEQMAPVYYGFQERYPGVIKLMNSLIYQGKRGGRPFATAIDGRKLYVYRGHEYAILNTMIQGSAAIILKQGAIDLDAHGLGNYLRLTIHDEFLLEAPVDIADEVLREAEKILTNRTDFAVPITWSGKVLTERWVKS